MNIKLLAREGLSSVVVFLVALPLCMGIAIASGVSPAVGLLSGIVGGLVVGSLAGSPLQVSGPAAGLTVLVYEIVQRHGLALLSVIVFVAGISQIVAGKLRLGQWFRAVSPGVLHAMLAGIGVLIVASQLHVMIDDAPAASGLTNLIALPGAFVKAVVPSDGTPPHHIAAMVGLLTLGTLAAWNLLQPHLPAALAVLPAPLLAVGVATGTAMVFDLQVAYVDVPEGLASMINPPSLADFASLAEPAILGSVIALACVASAESLLSASAVDKLHGGKRSDLDRELFAQGTGNVVLGLLGGLPVTGVIVRSSANVRAGAKTRLSAILHGAWLLLTVSLLPFVLETIPVASLAGVLVYVGYKLVDRRVIRELWRHSRGDFLVYVITVVSIVSTSLLVGLLIGLGLSVAQLAWKFSRIQVEVTRDETGTVDVDLRGIATFVVLPQLAAALEGIDPSAPVRIHLHHLGYIDHACFDLIRDWARQRESSSGGTLVMQWEELQMRSRRPTLLRAS